MAPATAARRPTTDDRLDRVFHALADRTRRALLARLAKGPGSVTELAAPFAMSLNAVSKHLKVLESAGLIAREVEGKVHRCSLAAAPLRTADQWLAFYRAFWAGNLDAVAAFVERETHERRRS